MRIIAIVTALTALWPAPGAWARAITYQLAIPAQPSQDALVALARQTDIVLGGTPACTGQSPSVRGRLALASALDRILAGSSCTYRIIDPQTVRIIARPSTPFPSRPAPISPDSPVVIEGLEVTATKTPGLAGRFSGAARVVGFDQIRDTGVTDTETLQRQIASFSITNLGPGRDKILLRGISDGAFTGRTQSTVGTYLDNVPINYNAPDPDLRLTDIKAVEVLFGPQGALYGGGSLGGVYRIVSRDPALGETSLKLSARGDIVEGGAPGDALDLIINLSLPDDRGALRVALFNERQGGYLRDDALRQSNVDLTKRSGGRAALNLPIGADWSAILSTTFQSLQSADTQYTTGPRPGRRRSNQVRESHYNAFSQNALVVRGSGGWGKLESTTAYVRHSFSSRYDASSVIQAFDPSGASVGLFDEQSSTNMTVEDLFWTSPADRPLHLMAGVFASFSSQQSPSDLQSRSGGALRSVYNEQRQDNINETALYGEASYRFSGDWTLAAGLRVFNTEVHTKSAVIAPAPGQSRSFDRIAYFGGASPKLSLRKDFRGGAYVYVLGSSGYRAGGFNSGGIDPPGPNRRQFQPDHLFNYEVGGEASLIPDRLTVRLAAFYDVWRNIQTDQYLSSGLSYTANVGDGRNIGVEASAAFKPTGNLSLQVSALVDSPQITRLNPNFTSAVGSRLPGVSNVSASLLAIERHPLSDGRSLVVTAETAYVGPSSLTFDPRYSPVTPGRYTANLSAQYQTPRYSIGLFLANPFNSSRDTFAYGNPFSFGQVRQVTPEKPRTLSLTLSRSW